MKGVWEAAEQCSTMALHWRLPAAAGGPPPAVAAARWKEVDNGGGGGGQEPVYEPISLDHTATILWVHTLIPLIPRVGACACFLCLFICLTCNRAVFVPDSQTV